MFNKLSNKHLFTAIAPPPKKKWIIYGITSVADSDCMTSLMGQCQIKRLLQASVYKYRWSPGDVIRVQIVCYEEMIQARSNS